MYRRRYIYVENKKLETESPTPDDIRWTIDKTEFDDLLALEKDSAPGPDGIPYGA